jgi:DNA polymerase-4
VAIESKKTTAALYYREMRLSRSTIRRAAGECLKRVPLERKIRLLGVRVGSLVRSAREAPAEIPL